MIRSAVPSASTITCPQCSHQFEPTAAMEHTLREKFKAEFNQKWVEQKKKQDAEVQQREAALQKETEALEAARRRHDEDVKREVEEACKAREKELTQSISEKVSGTYEARMQHLEESAREKDEALKEARTKEIEYLKKEEALRRRGEELELEKQRTLRDERVRISEDLRKQADEKEAERQRDYALRQKEWEIKFEQQKRLLEEAQRKAEQGSMQLQGEVQELALEDLLRAAFPHDVVKEVPKGVRGADCILTIRNIYGQECGCIVFESKRTKDFGGDWIDKLKTDMVTCCAELAVIVSQVLPKDIDRFGHKEGVYVCGFTEVGSLVAVLRQAILKLYEARKSQENKGDKMVMLYDYLTGTEFGAQWRNMRESFARFRAVLQKERTDFERNWKLKEKMLDSILLNSAQISGSIEGISGMDSMAWATLPEETALLD